MSDANVTTQQPPGDGRDADIEEKFMVRNPRLIRQLLQSLIEQRSLINAHIGGRDQSFPSAVLELEPDSDGLLLDGSPQAAINRAVEQASHLLCLAQLERVQVRFRLEHLEPVGNGNRTAFRAAFPEELCHLQRRELYRLETPINGSPTCRLTPREEDEAIELRVVDISGGGLALLLPPGMPPLTVQQRYRDCQLRFPDGPAIQVDLIACNMRIQVMPNGVEMQRVGLRFESLPRGSDTAIQRYIFRIERQRSARKSGDL